MDGDDEENGIDSADWVLVVWTDDFSNLFELIRFD